MAVVCPTVLALTSQDYERQMDRIASFAERVQIDLADGIFAPVKTTNLIQTWWPKDVQADIHLMYEKPHVELETLVSLRPSLVIIHAEAEGDLVSFVQHLKRFEIKTGVALLPETQVSDKRELISNVDHVLIFSGDLGRFGGKADLGLLKKVAQIHDINPAIEIGWDGGANADNIHELVAGGVDVVNVGGAIQRSEDSEKAYATLVAKL